MKAVEVDWRRATGRDGDGDRFDAWVLVHGSGRILARICLPTTQDYRHWVYFYVKVPESILPGGDENLLFIDADSAKRFVMDIIERFDPFAPAKPTAAISRRKVAA